MNWHNANSKEPCPICGKHDWCSMSNDGAVVVCRRTPNDKPTKNGNGWIYRLTAPTPQTPQTCSNVQPLPADIAGHFASLPEGDIQIRLCRYLSRTLGLPEDMLQRIDVRWDKDARAAAFPMRAADGTITGIRYRSLENGSKWSMKGSKDGLFMLTNLEDQVPSSTNPTPHPPEETSLVICEGPTDTMAAGAIGMLAVGRSSCTSGTRILCEYIARHKIRRVTIAADDDQPKTRPDGTTWRPGIEGAQRLQAELPVPSRIILPPRKFKDLREWYMKGAMTFAKFRTAEESATWYTPRRLGI